MPPPLAVLLEPFEAGKVVYLPMAPISSKSKARGRVFLRFDITNKGAVALDVSSVRVSFPGSSVPAETKSIGIQVNPMQTRRWWFSKPVDDVIFDMPGPSTIQVGFKCETFAELAAFAFPLAAHKSPVVGGSYLFPASATDLELGEFWSMNGCNHGMGAEGSQSFGYDMGVWGPDHDDGGYSWLKAKGSGTNNDDFRVWGKAIRAMAQGVVRQVLFDVPTNPKPLPGPDWAAQLAAQKAVAWGKYLTDHGYDYEDDLPHAGAGNHLYIQHGDEIMLYAHMQPNRVPAQLRTPGATVLPGQLLGYAGNSGNSSSPHLHIHAIQGTTPESGPLRPIILKDAWAIDNDLVINEPVRGFWSPLVGRGVPEGDPIHWDKQDCFLWPDKSLPEWPEILRVSVAENDYQSVVAGMADAGFRPVWIDAYTMELTPFSEGTFLNVVFRPATGVEWVARHGLSGNEYQTEFNKWVKDEKYRLVHIETYFSYALDRVAYAAIFTKTSGPDFVAYHGKTKAEHQQLFDDLTKDQAFVPVNISVVSTGGHRSYAALFDQRDAGSVEARSTLSIAEYQQKFVENDKRGLHLAYINSYVHGGEVNVVGIWYSAIASPYVQHHLDDEELDKLLKKQRNDNLYLRAITGYQRDRVANFAAIWNR